MKVLDSMFINEIQNLVAHQLPKKRYQHTLGVAYLASSLAMCYEIDTNKAMIAGLLHDIAKYVPYDEALTICRENQLNISDVEKRNPFLLHGKLGAFYAKTKYRIVDEEILSSIEFHTTGKPAMSLLEKIIFLSDYIEIYRSQVTEPSLTTIRSIAFKEIDLAVYYVLKNTLHYLSKTHQEIDQLTVETYEFYKKELNQ